jgi:hypothetical protein
MSNQPENEMQQTLTPEEVRQYALAEIEASKQAIADLSDEELEEIAGAAGSLSGMRAVYNTARSDGNGILTSAKFAWKSGRSLGSLYKEQLPVYMDHTTMEEHIQSPNQTLEHAYINTHP